MFILLILYKYVSFYNIELIIEFISPCNQKNELLENKMSVSQPKYHAKNENNFPMSINPIKKNYNNDKMSLANLVDNVNNNNLHIFYPKEDSLFKKRIDKLNLKFYLETEKFLSNQHNEGKCQDSLFIILFQQISLYIEEIERLNLLLQEKKGDPKFIKERVDEYIRRQKDFETKERLIQTLKDSKMNLEKKLSKLMCHEDKIKSENESLKRQNKFYQEQLQIYLDKEKEGEKTKPDSEIDTNLSIKLSKKVSKKRNYSDNNPNNNLNNLPVSPSNLNQNLQKQSNDLNQFRGGSKGPNSGNISNGTNLMEHNLKLSSQIPKNKKDLKIIKAVKEQLTRTASDDSNNSGNNVTIPIRCNSPIVNISKDNIKMSIQKCENEIKEMTFMEIYLKKMKFELMNENNKKNNNLKLYLNNGKSLTPNPLIDYGDKDNCNMNSHVHTEVMVSDLEDYDKFKTNGFQCLNNQKKNTYKNYTPSGLNSVTIDLDNSEGDNLNKYGFHNTKIKTPHFKTINIGSNNNDYTNANLTKQKKIFYK